MSKIKSKTPSKFKIYCLLAIATVAVSTAAIWICLAMEVANDRTVGFSSFLAASRLIIAAILILPTNSKAKFQATNTKAIFFSIVAGLCLAGHFATWIASLGLTSILASTALVTTNPIWVAILSRIFFKEKLSKWTTVGIVIAFVGALTIALESITDFSYSNSFTGNCLALTGALFASLYILAGTQAQKQGLSTRLYISIAYSVAAVAIFPLPLIFRTSYLGHKPLVYLYALLMAVIAQLIGHSLFNWSLRWLSPTVIALVVLCEPIISSLLGIVIFQEIPSPSLFWGGMILIMGVLIAIKFQPQKSK